MAPAIGLATRRMTHGPMMHTSMMTRSTQNCSLRYLRNPAAGLTERTTSPPPGGTPGGWSGTRRYLTIAPQTPR
jgi:hypothetical protein